MKKVLALVLAAVMALSLATVVSAITVTPADPATPGSSTTTPDTFLFDGKDQEFKIVPDDAFTTVGDSETFAKGKDDALSYTVSSSKPDMLAASIKTIDVKDAAGKVVIGKTLTLVLNPADEYFTVQETKVNIKIVVSQKIKGQDAVTGTYEIKDTIVVKNATEPKASFVENADGKKIDTFGTLSAPVIEETVFTELAKGKALEIKYSDYSVNFAKVSAQNTALYLKAKTGVVATPTKAIASIKFQPTRVKDAATITMPISADNENLYGEKVFVYALVDSKPSGEAIEGTVVNHNSVIFSVPAGTALGTFAAYGDKALGDAEKPAIPETGANDIVNIAIVFAVVALAAAGFVAVKKASK